MDFDLLKKKQLHELTPGVRKRLQPANMSRHIRASSPNEAPFEEESQWVPSSEPEIVPNETLPHVPPSRRRVSNFVRPALHNALLQQNIATKFGLTKESKEKKPKKTAKEKKLEIAMQPKERKPRKTYARKIKVPQPNSVARIPRIIKNTKTQKTAASEKKQKLNDFENIIEDFDSENETLESDKTKKALENSVSDQEAKSFQASSMDAISLTDNESSSSSSSLGVNNKTDKKKTFSKAKARTASTQNSTRTAQQESTLVESVENFEKIISDIFYKVTPTISDTDSSYDSTITKLSTVENRNMATNAVEALDSKHTVKNFNKPNYSLDEFQFTKSATVSPNDSFNLSEEFESTTKAKATVLLKLTKQPTIGPTKAHVDRCPTKSTATLDEFLFTKSPTSSSNDSFDCSQEFATATKAKAIKLSKPTKKLADKEHGYLCISKSTTSLDEFLFTKSPTFFDCSQEFESATKSKAFVLSKPARMSTTGTMEEPGDHCQFKTTFSTENEIDHAKSSKKMKAKKNIADKQSISSEKSSSNSQVPDSHLSNSTRYSSFTRPYKGKLSKLQERKLFRSSEKKPTCASQQAKVDSSRAKTVSNEALTDYNLSEDFAFNENGNHVEELKDSFLPQPGQNIQKQVEAFNFENYKSSDLGQRFFQVGSKKFSNQKASLTAREVSREPKHDGPSLSPWSSKTIKENSSSFDKHKSSDSKYFLNQESSLTNMERLRERKSVAKYIEDKTSKADVSKTSMQNENMKFNNKEKLPAQASMANEVLEQNGSNENNEKVTEISKSNISKGTDPKPLMSESKLDTPMSGAQLGQNENKTYPSSKQKQHKHSSKSFVDIATRAVLENGTEDHYSALTIENSTIFNNSREVSAQKGMYTEEDVIKYTKSQQISSIDSEKSRKKTKHAKSKDYKPTKHKNKSERPENQGVYKKHSSKYFEKELPFNANLFESCQFQENPGLTNSSYIRNTTLENSSEAALPQNSTVESLTEEQPLIKRVPKSTRSSSTSTTTRNMHKPKKIRLDLVLTEPKQFGSHLSSSGKVEKSKHIPALAQKTPNHQDSMMLKNVSDHTNFSEQHKQLTEMDTEVLETLPTNNKILAINSEPPALNRESQRFPKTCITDNSGNLKQTNQYSETANSSSKHSKVPDSIATVAATLSTEKQNVDPNYLSSKAHTSSKEQSALIPATPYIEKHNMDYLFETPSIMNNGPDGSKSANKGDKSMKSRHKSSEHKKQKNSVKGTKNLADKTTANMNKPVQIAKCSRSQNISESIELENLQLCSENQATNSYQTVLITAVMKSSKLEDQQNSQLSLQKLSQTKSSNKSAASTSKHVKELSKKKQRDIHSICTDPNYITRSDGGLGLDLELTSTKCVNKTKDSEKSKSLSHTIADFQNINSPITEARNRARKAEKSKFFQTKHATDDKLLHTRKRSAPNQAESIKSFKRKAELPTLVALSNDSTKNIEVTCNTTSQQVLPATKSKSRKRALDNAFEEPPITENEFHNLFDDMVARTENFLKNKQKHTLKSKSVKSEHYKRKKIREESLINDQQFHDLFDDMVARSEKFIKNKQSFVI